MEINEAKSILYSKNYLAILKKKKYTPLKYLAKFFYQKGHGKELKYLKTKLDQLQIVPFYSQLSYFIPKEKEKAAEEEKEARRRKKKK